MKAYEFPARVTADGGLDVPEDVRRRLQADAVVRVLVLVEESGEVGDGAWSQLAGEQLLAQYADADAIYDRVP